MGDIEKNQAEIFLAEEYNDWTKKVNRELQLSYLKSRSFKIIQSGDQK